MMTYCRSLILLLSIVLSVSVEARPMGKHWPDGSPMSPWFLEKGKVEDVSLGRRFIVTEYGVLRDSTRVQTAQLQHVIDIAAESGGGVVVIPRGIFLSGSLFFRPHTSLLLEEGARLKGSDRIEDFPVVDTRIEGESCRYFAALVNADGVDGFTIAGKGCIDGNGYHYWKEFWIRRQWNPACTNKDAQRPRLVYIANSKDVTVQDVTLINSPFWTNHLYRCQRVRYLDCTIISPTQGLKAPSSDAIDLDVCSDVVVRGCYMSVNDDAVVLKGGKGTWADTMSENGPNGNVLVENCHYGEVHGCLVLGSESLHDRNVVLRNVVADNVDRVLWLKMRPDTPQHYEHILVDGIKGRTGSFLVVRPWTQFYKMDDRTDMPLSRCNDVTMRNVDMQCRNFFDVGLSDKYSLSGFTFENINVTDDVKAFAVEMISGTVVRNVVVNGVSVH